MENIAVKNQKKNELKDRLKQIVTRINKNASDVARMSGINRTTLVSAMKGSSEGFGADILASLINGIGLTKEDIYYILTGKKQSEPVPTEHDGKKSPSELELDECKKLVEKLNKDIEWQRSHIDKLANALEGKSHHTEEHQGRVNSGSLVKNVDPRAPD